MKQLFLLIILFISVRCHAQSNNKATQWTEDVEFVLEKILTVHPNPFRNYSLKEWQEKAEVLKKKVPENEVKASLEIFKFLALIGDGHTEYVYTPKSMRGFWLPLHIRNFSEGWFIRTADPKYKALFGHPITHFNGMGINEIVAMLKPFISCDNEVGALDGIGNLMRNAIILEALGISSGKSVEITVKNDLGKKISMKVMATAEPWVADDWVDVDELLNPGEKPKYRTFRRNYDFEYLKNEKTIYVWFEKIRDDDGESMAAFFKRVFKFIDENEVSKFVLDIRENSGGNLDLNGPLFHGLMACEKVNYPGGLFVIIGRDTYSAAMNLSVLLERHTYALFVGEPTGATPNHFGDTKEFKLPNTDLKIEISELYWQHSDPRDNRKWITPDISISNSFKDFVAHRDQLLNAALKYKITEAKKKSLEPLLMRWFRASLGE